MQKQFLSILATGTMLLSTLTPAVLADTQESLSGNGAASQNTVTSTSNNTQTVVQNNNAQVTNTVSSNSSTGNNTANDNTGGDVTVDTGNAVNSTDIRTRANANVADVSGTNSNNGGTSVTLSGNGAFSQNRATTRNTNDSSLFQTNDANVTNDVQSNARTGNNNANDNTGGDILVLTGHAANGTTLSTAVNANIARMNGTGDNSGMGSDVLLSGNGARSNNSVDLSGNNSVSLVQNNQANVHNRVNADSNTGYNNANDNTGGDVTVDTGNALNTTDVRNLANFNSADLTNCGCTIGSNLDNVSGNGAFSQNQLSSANADILSTFQTSNADTNNDVMGNNRSGHNIASDNTGDTFAATAIDPVTVVTGRGSADTAVSTAANVNSFGQQLQLPGGLSVDLTFDLNGLLNMLHM